jgi:hypothetical protein
MPPGLKCRWLQLQSLGGLPGVCIDAVSEQGVHSIKRRGFGSIRIQSQRAEVLVETWHAVVETVRKMITKIGKSWGIYSKLQITMEWMPVNLHVLINLLPSAYSYKLPVIPTVPQFAVSLSDAVCLFLCINTLQWVTANILCVIDINRKFFNRQDIRWCWD